MEASRLEGRARQRLLALLKTDQPEPHRWMNRLRELRSADEIPACSTLFRMLTQLELAEDEAEAMLLEILRHRDDISRALGRDAGLRVATIDYLSNFDRRLVNPKIVELSEFERTERSAATDPLTRLYNRRFFRETLDREVRRSRRYHLALSLVMLDLDDFKQINDAYGHLFGDLVLQKTARLVRRSIREADVPCRYGGEEFAIILPETGRLGAHAVANRIRASAESSFAGEATGGRIVAVTVSGGIATHPADGLEPGTLVTRADEALYLAKRGGKNRITLYHHERRRWVRYPAPREARVRVETAVDGTSQPALAVNLSRSGALLETTAPLQPASQVRIVLGQDEPAPRRGEIALDGRVVRVETRTGGRTGAFRIGVAFDQPVPEECLELATPRQRFRYGRRGGQ